MMKPPKFQVSHLVPVEIETCANILAEHVAGIHRETGEYSIMTITMKDVILSGEPMGDYEVTVRQIQPPDFLELDAEE